MSNKIKIKLIIGITAPQSVDLLNGQLKYFINQNYEVYLLAPDHVQVKDFCTVEGATHIPIKIERNISIWKDLLTLVQLIRIFSKYKPDIVNLGTPKISLVGMIAAYFVGVKVRIYTCRGFRFEHEQGFFRKFLIGIEKLISYFSHKVICISNSVKDLGIEENIFKENTTVHIAKGSSNGINLENFNPKKVSEKKKQDFLDRFNLNDNFIFGFVGRLVDRKGIVELFASFDKIHKIHPQARLLVVGRPYWDQITNPQIIENFNNHPGIIMAGLQPPESIPAFLSVMDVFVLPAWWEGFGNVLIQAAAMGVPIISTESTGCKDAVKDGFNGILVPPYSVESFTKKMLEFIIDKYLREELGKNGLIWAKNFNPEIIWKGQQELYETMLSLDSTSVAPVK